MLVGTTNLNTTLNLIYVLTDVVETLLNKGMKKRYTKKGEFICRRQKPSDKSFSLKESYRLAYFEVMNRPAYISVNGRLTMSFMLAGIKEKPIDFSNSLINNPQYSLDMN